MLGRGSFGTVYLKDIFAVKKSRAKDFECLQAIVRELIVLRMNLKGCIKYHQVKSIGSVFYIYMDLADGNLRQIKAPKNFETQLIQAVQELHRHDIVHRDLKPANILVRKDQIFLCDFGLSRSLNSDFSNNQNIFVISSDKEMTNIKNKNEIIDLNNFTNTSPAYRANLKIKIDGGGFSSYQSEYPFHMTTKNGNVLSPLSTLLNIDADKNFLVFKNIYYKAINEKFNIYIINVKSKKILKKYIGICNQTNIFEINKDIIHYENFIFSENFLGIPIYVSIKNNHISMEHTHPPHEYILSKDKFYRVSLLKKKINEIIN